MLQILRSDVTFIVHPTQFVFCLSSHPLLNTVDKQTHTHTHTYIYIYSPVTTMVFRKIFKSRRSRSTRYSGNNANTNHNKSSNNKSNNNGNDNMIVNNFSGISSLGASYSSDSGVVACDPSCLMMLATTMTTTKDRRNYNAIVETVMSAEDYDHDDDDDDDDMQDQQDPSSSSFAIYMFPSVWKERTGSRCYGAYDTIDLDNNRSNNDNGNDNDNDGGRQGPAEDDDENELQLFGSTVINNNNNENEDDAWDTTIVVDEDRYKRDQPSSISQSSSPWLSLSCLSCV